ISLEPRVGTIRFATQSPEAQFRLFNSSGELIAEWSGINLIRDIPAGRYEYRGQLEGYRELAGQLVVRENETTRVNAQLIEAQRSSEDQQRKRNINEQVPPGQGATTIQPSPQRPSAGDENPQQDGSREDEDEILTVVEEMPQMRGGQAALYEALEYPRRARIYNIEGRVIIQFVVDQQGNVSNIEVVRSVDDDLDEAAIEAMRNMTFSPGMQGGRPVRVRMVQPVIFRLQ
ncbi:MAG: TonB family protein, partial [Cyclonatronaceae bacterium]